MLAGTGCAAGCALAYFGIKELVPLIPHNNFPQESVIAINWIVLGVGMGLAFTATMLCGLYPALRVVARPLQPRLVCSGLGTGAGLQHGGLRAALVVAEVALSLVLLAGAGLLLRSFFGMTHVNLGYDPRNILPVHLELPPGRYEKREQRKLFFDELLAKVRTLPGVLDATAVLWPEPAAPKRWCQYQVRRTAKRHRRAGIWLAKIFFKYSILACYMVELFQTKTRPGGAKSSS